MACCRWGEGASITEVDIVDGVEAVRAELLLGVCYALGDVLSLLDGALCREEGFIEEGGACALRVVQIGVA